MVDEIPVRLLRTSIGARVAQIGHAKSGVQQVAEAVSWIREHFAQPVTVDERATSVHMSASSFHRRFKAVATMSPLQYQKVLRLHEARRLMLFEKVDAKRRVSSRRLLEPVPVQQRVRAFIRECADQDIARLRGEGLGRLALRGPLIVRSRRSARRVTGR